MANTSKKNTEARTTVGVRQSTKDRLDQNRAPGQCYDGFLCQLVDLWEDAKNSKPADKK
jgi:hypothetical protein